MPAPRLFLSIALASGVPFGLLTGVVTAMSFGSPGAGLTAGLPVGLLLGVLMAAAVSTGRAVTGRAAERVPPGLAHVPVTANAGLPDRIVTALRSLPAELVLTDVPAGRYVAHSPRTWRGSGEEVVVQLTGHPQAPVALVTSAARERTLLADRGRDETNVHRVLELLAR